MTVEPKDIKFLKNDYSLKIRAMSSKLSSLERRLGWIEKLLWLFAGALISWLAHFIKL